MVLFYKIRKKYNEIQLTKRMDLNNLKNNKSSSLPRNNNMTEHGTLLASLSQGWQQNDGSSPRRPLYTYGNKG